ncbi:FAD-dependent monooxygenase [Ochrobactrum quorumnocens]|uniref:FAD-dependent monooxygenase n=1 Tax=Ochrobactrum quorumnocens TaxID=271865 RepID=UPI001ABFCF77
MRLLHPCCLNTPLSKHRIGPLHHGAVIPKRTIPIYNIQVLIIGGSLVGLSAAAFLAWRGVKATVIAIIAFAPAASVAPTPIEPRPPAMHTSAASAGVDTPAISA